MILDQFRLNDKIAVVTGSRRGIGRAIAAGLAEAGADIVGFDRNDPAETRTEIEGIGRKYLWKQVDMVSATPADFTRLVEETTAARGRIDILVNNAGICPRRPLLEYTEADWTETLQVDLNAPWFLAQIVARRMVDQGGGKIVNVSSLIGVQGGYTVPGYAAAKHGVLGLTKAMANELAGKNVNVNALIPGYIATDFTQPLQDDPVRNPQIEVRIPAGRWGRPRDLAGAAVLLASDAGNYIHGTAIAVDGGWLGR
jgi:2-deoxy-D-gluconate 3-dehydrogenase